MMGKWNSRWKLLLSKIYGKANTEDTREEKINISVLHVETKAKELIKDKIDKVNYDLGCEK